MKHLINNKFRFAYCIVVLFFSYSNIFAIADGETIDNATKLVQLEEYYPDIQQLNQPITNYTMPLWESFNFNNGTVQSWTTIGPYDEDGDGPFPSHFSSCWDDATNHPNSALTDPLGNNRGSFKICNVSGHGISNPGATYWYMYWQSPDLTTSPNWQNASGYTVKLLNYMELIAPVPGTHLVLAINLHVTVYDPGQARDRYFRITYENIQNWLQNPVWIEKTMAFSGDITSIANKSIKYIMVSVRGQMADYFEGGIYLDEIVPYGSGPANPQISLDLSDLDFGMTKNNLSFKISNSGSGTLTWNVTESPNKAWITSISPSSGSGNATINVAIYRNQLNDNVETGTLLVASNGGDEYVTVQAARDTVSQWIRADIETKLKADDGAEQDLFGRDVAIDSIFAAVGASDDDNENGTDAGAVYMFMRSGNTWTQTQKLVAPDGGAEEYFGYSVDIDGDYMVIAACWDDEFGEKSGSAYIYKRTGSTWAMQQKITASDAGEDNRFGIKAAISGKYVIVGAFFDNDFGTRSGSAYIFERTGTEWIQREILLASDGAENDWFGVFVSIDRDFAVVGSRYDDNENGNDAGAVYIFERSGDDWIEQKKIIASDGAAGDLFHVSALQGNYLVVGAYQDDDMGDNSGSIYIYEYNGLNWIQQSKIVASDGHSDAYFGDGLDIDANRIIAGAYRSDDHAGNSGSIYVIEHNGTSWEETEKIISSDGSSGDFFGLPVEIDQGYVIVGARNDDDLGVNSGAAYVYALGSNPALAIAPSTLDFGTDKDFLTMQITNSGGGTISWFISVLSSMPWLTSIEPFSSTGDATVTFTVDRSQMTASSETGTIQVNSNGGNQTVTLQIELVTDVSAAATEQSLPDKFQLFQNYPNPFNPVTHISFDLAEKSNIRLTLFDIHGRLVKTIYTGHKDAGHYEILWDAKNSNGEDVPSGVYIYQLTTDDYTFNRKMILLK